MHEAAVSLGNPIQYGIFLHECFALRNGKIHLYTTGSGNPCVFNDYNVTDDVLVAAHEMPGSLHCWSHVVAGDGTVYITPMDQAKLFRYQPDTGAFEDLGTILDQVAAYQPQVDPLGRVYVGTYPAGSVVRYDPQTASLRDYGPAVEGHRYVRSLAYDRGCLYAGTAARGARIVRIDAETGQRRVLPLPGGRDPALFESFYALTVVERLLFAYAYYGEERLLLVYHLDAETWLDVCVEGFGGLFVSPPIEGKAYFCVQSEFWSFDLATYATENTHVPAPENGKGFGVVRRPADANDVLMAVDHSGSLDLLFVDFRTGKTERMPMRERLRGGALNLHALEAGPRRCLYMGAYMGGTARAYQVDTGAFTTLAVGQTEGMVQAGDDLYLGVYPGGRIYRYDGEAVALVRAIGEEQDRPFAMLYAEDALFIGTVPDYNRLGGALTVYRPQTDDWSVHRHLIPNQSVTGLAYRAGRVYGGTGIWGGLGIDPSEKEGMLFVWDIAAGRVAASAIPALQGLAAPVDKIGGLAFGPDGLLWAVGRAGDAQAVLFCVAPDTLQVMWQRVYALETPMSTWRPAPLRFGPDGRLYAGIDGILRVDIQSCNAERLIPGPVTLFAFGADGALYYSAGPALWKLARA